VRTGAIDPSAADINVNRTALMTQGGTVATNSRRDVSLRVRRSTRRRCKNCAIGRCARTDVARTLRAHRGETSCSIATLRSTDGTFHWPGNIGCSLLACAEDSSA
jgi:hypothetical protein